MSNNRFGKNKNAGCRAHVLYKRWHTFSRSDRVFKVCKLWQKDFWSFANTVGKPPKSHVSILPVNRAKPIGPTNWRWGEDWTHTAAKRRATYVRNWHEKKVKREGAFWRHESRRLKYGITKEQYAAMQEAQGFVCYICERPERKIIAGRVIDLSVDHDHITNKVRGLLCARCNLAISNFDDSPVRLRKAAEYLEAHRISQHALEVI